MAKEPAVIIIYTPSDGNMYMFGAHRVKGNWRFSKSVTLPAEDFDGFVAWRISEGMACMDVRQSADKAIPGMSKATPVILWQKWSNIREAVDAASKLHTAILNSPDD